MNTPEMVTPNLVTDGRGLFGHVDAPSYRRIEKAGTRWVFLQRQSTTQERKILKKSKMKYMWQLLMPLLPGEQVPSGNDVHVLVKFNGGKYHGIQGLADMPVSENERFVLWKKYRNEQLLAQRAIAPDWVSTLGKKLLEHFYPDMKTRGEIKYSEWIAWMTKHVHPSFLTRECNGFLNGGTANVELNSFLEALKKQRPSGHIRLSLDIFLWSHWRDLTEPGMNSIKAYELACEILGQNVAGKLDAFQKHLNRSNIQLAPARRPSK